MKLRYLSYKEDFVKDGANSWELEKLLLGKNAVILGQNSTGKTRIINVIQNFAKLLQKQQIFNGNWVAIFCDDQDRKYKYCLSCEGGKVISEKVFIDGIKKMDRTSTSAQIFSESANEWERISLGQDKLLPYIQKDNAEYPFLSKIFTWAAGVRTFSFPNTSPNQIEIPASPKHLTSLNAVPSVLDQLDGEQVRTVLAQLEKMGYNLETVSAGTAEGLPPTAKIIFFKEHGIENALKQVEISQGIYRAFAMLTIMGFLRSDKETSTVLIDDFGEGLDGERSKKLAQILFREKFPFQIIATSNDPDLLGAVPLPYVSICYRVQGKVKCLSYSGAKEKFDQWQQRALNNFDLFSQEELK